MAVDSDNINPNLLDYDYHPALVASTPVLLPISWFAVHLLRNPPIMILNSDFLQSRSTFVVSTRVRMVARAWKMELEFFADARMTIVESSAKVNTTINFKSVVLHVRNQILES